jgi:hypothetical protein
MPAPSAQAPPDNSAKVATIATALKPIRCIAATIDRRKECQFIPQVCAGSEKKPIALSPKKIRYKSNRTFSTCETSNILFNSGLHQICGSKESLNPQPAQNPGCPCPPPLLRKNVILWDLDTPIV